ncbi:valine--tRNA ligase [Candidatus Woesearchaeota archaeon]|nr:valine--tRNA ligase [Candidatus Woesearchaeota archaeon]
MQLPKNYNAKEAEKKWSSYWEKELIYAFDQKSDKEIYSIDTPPPTVSGKMHLGHSFSYSQQDFLARYKRMKGFNVFYPYGTDDNGLATERLVERINNVKSKDMKREEFIKLCLKTLKKIRPDFVQDWKNIGVSCDFSIFYSTINDHCRKISQKSFIDLYKDGREFRKEAPTMWCPECQTAIAQVELEDKDLKSYFNDIIFKLENGQDLIIATTRPELLGACVAIFAHPDDKRYKQLFGKKAKVPLYDLWVEIIPSEKADPEKGTGILMCCTFGDQDDIEHYKAHNLDLRMIITKDGKMNKLSGKYEGMKIEEARHAIIDDLKANNLLIKQEPLKHTVNVHERCGTPIEIMNTKQWFIRYLDLKDKFLEAGAAMKWFPEHMRIRLDHWIYGLQWDWCISRQRHFGIPFPVWYCKKCDEAVLADIKDLPVDPTEDKPPVKKCPKCGHNEFIAEKDVLDTWATSSLSPQLAVELMKGKPFYKKLFPMDLRPQAHDIITFWLFNTMVKSQLHYNKNPWKNIMISGFALDPHGKKMSKSKGNTIAPQDMIEKYSADCLRFWAAGSKLGEDLPFQEKDLVTGKKMTTKLWNASKFAIMHLQDFKYERHELETMDKWLISKLQKLIKKCTESFDEYEYSKVKSETENFFWNVFCDQYLEIVKDRLYNPDKYHEGARESAQFGLYEGILNILKLMAPIMPFITEEIYHLYFDKIENKKSIHNSDWPECNESYIDKKAENAGDHAVDIISAVRKFKSDSQLSLKTELSELIIDCDDKTRKLIELVLSDITSTTKAKDIVFGKGKIKVNEEVKIGIKK